MQIRIAPTRLISEIQQEFNKMFPFLKLEFFRNKGYQEAPVVYQFVPHHRKLGEYQTGITDGILEINEDMKVKDLEKKFKDEFKLNAQVFRRSGNLWLQTTMTDDWTLGNQNKHGMEISLFRKSPLANEEDRDIARD